MSLDVIYDPRFAEHLTGVGHPERPQRLAALIEGLREGGAPPETYRAPALADASILSAVHDEAYMALIERFCDAIPEESVAELPTGDTTAGHESYRIAMLAAGAAVEAARSAKLNAPTLALVRPPGHHAEPARGMGFCLLNNVALAAETARRLRGPTLIVDFDYHHGNGTQAWVERVLDRGDGAPLGFISTHAYPAYPGTGPFEDSRYARNGFVIDIPLGLETTTADFVDVWARLLPPLAKAFKPSTIVVSAGFDFIHGDPIAGLAVAPDAVQALSALLGETAAEHNAALAFVLEGGYSLPNLRASGAMLARSFGAEATRVHVPSGHAPGDERLSAMTAEVLGWL